MRVLSAVVMFALLLSNPWTVPAARSQAASSARQKINVSKLGPQVGQRVPDFNLQDQNGQVRSLKSIMGPRGAMIVFVRSADWCPFCRTQLVELQSRVEELRKHGLGLASISYDSREILVDFSKRHRISYPMLSDVGSATIKRYGILNTVVDEALGPDGNDPAVRARITMYQTANEPAERHRGIPFPGTFVVDAEGRVTSRFFEDAYWERNSVSNILVRIGAAQTPVQAQQVSTAHLDARAYVTDTNIALGTKFSAAVDVTPKRGMHVYAPGAAGYQIVSLKIEPQPYVRIQPRPYPRSEIYHFVPLNERVPVYHTPFTLGADVVAEATAEARKALAGKTELVLTGALAYQACDDRICYNPVSLPLSWKVTLQPLVAAAQQPQR